ncbi:MAG: hypothetical protein V1717_01195 [Candidatus Micrarchaeota archaeon]
MVEKEVVALGVIVLLVFAGVFYFASQKPAETLIENSLLVKSKDPIEDVSKRLLLERILVEQRLYAQNDTRNSFIAIMSSEIARALALRGKNVTVYGIVEGGGENVCFETNCTGASIVVKSGTCDCVFFEGEKVFVEGSEKFLNEQSVRVGRLFGFSVFKKEE